MHNVGPIESIQQCTNEEVLNNQSVGDTEHVFLQIFFSSSAVSLFSVLFHHSSSSAKSFLSLYALIFLLLEQTISTSYMSYTYVILLILIEHMHLLASKRTCIMLKHQKLKKYSISSSRTCQFIGPSKQKSMTLIVYFFLEIPRTANCCNSWVVPLKPTDKAH